jgi:murein L,D-transpeptidase YcbB/YkuD
LRKFSGGSVSLKKISLFLGLIISTTCLTTMPLMANAEGRDENNFSQWQKKQERAESSKRSENTRSRKVEKRRRQARTNRSQGFFEVLFGAPRRRAARPSSGLPYWGSRSQPRAAEAAAPAPAPMPVFNTYSPTPLVALSVAGLTGKVAAYPVAKGIYGELRNSTEPVLRVERAERKAIVDFYKAREFTPAWVGDYGISIRGLRVLDVLSKSSSEGLESAAYLPPSMTSFDQSPERFKGNDNALSRLDIELTAMVLKFARHAYSGQIQPMRLSESLDVKPETLPAEKIITAVVNTIHPEDYLDGLHPTHPVYEVMKAELQRLGVGGRRNALARIPDGPSIRAGEIDERLPLLRKHLEQRGFLTNSTSKKITSEPAASTETPDGIKFENTGAGPVYDQELIDAVRAFQAAKNLQADGILGARTLGALNGKTPKNRVATLKANMERMRWLPKQLGYRHVFVNQAAYQVRVVEGDQVVHQTRVIVGKKKFPTPMFSDQMETVVFNPYWNVPKSIARNEFLPKLWDDPGYLDRNGYEVINTRGQQVSSYSIDWWNYSGYDLPYDIRQTPGHGNALGEIKFLFPNKHSVYLHDTPSKNLFNKPSRAFSHGCVRVQNPRKFAEVLLGWNTDRVNSAIDGGTNHSVKLSKKIPVHLTYFTAWPDHSGRLRYRADVYGRDTAVLQAMNKTRIAMR